MSVRPVLALFPAIALAVAACGVPAGDDTFEPIENADVPLNLADAATTTTTSTTTTSLPTPETTTTIPEVEPETEPVRLYFLARDELREVRREIESGFTPIELIFLLAAGPDSDTSPGLETKVLEGMVNRINVRAGTATVDIDQSVFLRLPRADRTSAYAQIVITLTQNATRAGLVTFTFDGDPENVPNANNLLKRNLSFEDFASLIANAVVIEPPPTTSTTVPEATTIPPESTSTIEAVAEPSEATSTSDPPAGSTTTPG